MNERVYRTFLFPADTSAGAEDVALVSFDGDVFRFFATRKALTETCNCFEMFYDSSAVTWLAKLGEVCQSAQQALEDNKEFLYLDFLGDRWKEAPLLRVELLKDLGLQFFFELVHPKGGIFKEWLLMTPKDPSVKSAVRQFLERMARVSSEGLDMLAHGSSR